MKLIPLSNGMTAKVDDDDYAELSSHKWTAQYNKATKSFYAAREVMNKRILMHRTVANTKNGMYADHINHDTLDNRKDNLRNVTSWQSAINRKIRSDNKSGVKGVSKKGKLFYAQITYKKKKYTSSCSRSCYHDAREWSTRGSRSFRQSPGWCVMNGWTETEEQAHARFERRNAEHERIMAEKVAAEETTITQDGVRVAKG